MTGPDSEDNEATFWGDCLLALVCALAVVLLMYGADGSWFEYLVDMLWRVNLMP